MSNHRIWRTDRSTNLRFHQYQGAGRAGSGAAAPGHVYRFDRGNGPAPPGLRSGRQLRGRSPGRLLHRSQRHHSRRQLRHRDRQRPRHSGRHARRGRRLGGAGGDDQAARRRQVRFQKLQGFGRPARRRRELRQRALGAAGAGDLARRLHLAAGIRLRHSQRRRWPKPARPGARPEPASPSSPTPPSWRRRCSTTTPWPTACASWRSSTRA